MSRWSWCFLVLLAGCQSDPDSNEDLNDGGDEQTSSPSATDFDGLWQVDEIVFSGESEELVGTMRFQSTSETGCEIHLLFGMLEGLQLAEVMEETMAATLEPNRWLIHLEDDELQVFDFDHSDDTITLTWNPEDPDDQSEEGEAPERIVFSRARPPAWTDVWTGVSYTKGPESFAAGDCVEHDEAGWVTYQFDFDFQDSAYFLSSRPSHRWTDPDCTVAAAADDEDFAVDGVWEGDNERVVLYQRESDEHERTTQITYDVDHAGDALTLESVDCEPRPDCEEDLGLTIELER